MQNKTINIHTIVNIIVTFCRLQIHEHIRIQIYFKILTQEVYFH